MDRNDELELSDRLKELRAETARHAEEMQAKILQAEASYKKWRNITAPITWSLMFLNVLTVGYPLIVLGFEQIGIDVRYERFLPQPAQVLLYLAQNAPVLITIGGVCVAAFLFFLRGFFPKIYGNLEIFVGLAAINHSSISVPNLDLPSLLPFMTGVYVVIRGLDNVAKGLNPKKRTARLFNRLFNNPPIKK